MPVKYLLIIIYALVRYIGYICEYSKYEVEAGVLRGESTKYIELSYAEGKIQTNLRSLN